MALNRKSRKALQIGFKWKNLHKGKGSAKGQKINYKRPMSKVKVYNKVLKKVKGFNSNANYIESEKLNKLNKLINNLANDYVLKVNQEIILKSKVYSYDDLYKKIELIHSEQLEKENRIQMVHDEKQIIRIFKKIKPLPPLLDKDAFRNKYYNLSKLSKRELGSALEKKAFIPFPDLNRMMDRLKENK